MRHFSLHLPMTLCLAVALAFAVCLPAVRAVEVIQLTENNWDDFVPRGKEVDCIYGDTVVRNKNLVAVIAEAIPTRNANMTVRNVGGSVIDLTVRDPQSDQLSAYYPLGARYKLTGPVVSEGDAVQLRFRGPAADGNSEAEVVYELADDSKWLKITTRVTNTGDKPLELSLLDAIRADGEFEFGADEALGLFWAYDPHWRQAYGALLADPAWKFATDELKPRSRPALRLERKDGKSPALPPGESLEIVRCLFPASNTIEARALANEIRGKSLSTVALDVRDPEGPLNGAEVAVKNSSGEPYAHGKTDAKGRLIARLPAGSYQAVVSAQGRGEKTVQLDASKRTQQKVELPAPGYVVANITAAGGEGPIPLKVEFSGTGGVADPNFGPDSAIHGVRNLYYTHDGKFRVPLAPGEYDVVISHGPEFDAVFTTVKVERGKESQLTAQLERTVDTTGWLSSDFHSHSTPSGDNTASQRGRVLNLLAEHIEFAPCTEHNRLTVYDAHLKHFGAVDQMLTCPGMELTGSPGSVNHQNAFPMKPRPRTQDGGAPVTDADPVVQIERLAMWHDGSDKLVQINHPNIVQMVGDRDSDGSPDGGFEKMFSFMDVIEVHPLGRIFDGPQPTSERRRGNTMFNWLQLLNLGYRTPGVVNTDAHWNFHGSGGLRNYIKSSTDEATKASVADLVHACEHGNIMMTNGPFMEVKAAADKGSATATVGDDLDAPGGKLHLKVRVQCPNWLEVNRVQVFVNGKPQEKWNFTRRTHPKMFAQGTVVFDEDLELALDNDAHLVVACAGEGQKLGPVMGPRWGEAMPAAVGNPIFVDVDGNGFKPNGDMLGMPLPVQPGHKPSKPHRHEH